MRTTPRTPELRCLLNTLKSVYPLSRTLAMSRRDFLKSTGGISMGILGSQLPSLQPNQTPRIAIVGAGLAGTTCAYWLHKAGVNATVYEASERVGGRTYSVVGALGTNLVTELGAEFINPEHADMLALVEEFGLDLVRVFPPDDDDDLSFFDGKILTDEAFADLLAPVADQISADVASLEEDDAYARFERMSVADYFAEVGITGTLYKIFEAPLYGEFGAPLDEQNALNFLYLAHYWVGDDEEDDEPSDEPQEGEETWRIGGGNQQIAQLASEAIGGVQLQHRLQALVQTGDTYELTFDTPTGTVQVQAEFVVLAIPLTVLRGITLDVRGISEDMRTAISELGYGMNGKLIVGMAERPWRDEGYSGDISTDEIFQTSWESAHNADTNETALTFYVGGDEGVRFAEGSAESVADSYLDAFEMIFAGTKAHYTGKHLRQAWSVLPDSLGAYSCPKAAQYDFPETLSQPIGKVFLAGEHTSPDFWGFMNGAAQSGRRVSEAIVRLLS
jgi:monoamine oxidase